MPTEERPTDCHVAISPRAAIIPLSLSLSFSSISYCLVCAERRKKRRSVGRLPKTPAKEKREEIKVTATLTISIKSCSLSPILWRFSLSQRHPINKNTNTFNQTNNSSRARAQSPKQLRLRRYINTNSRYYVYSRVGVESQQPTRKSFNWLTGFSDFWFSLGSSHPTHTK